MATMPSSFTRFQSSLPAARVQPGVQRVAPSRLPAPRTGNLFTLPKEPEDARLTGGTRSLDRRLLALNIAGSLPRQTFSGPVLAKPGPASDRFAAKQPAVA